MFTIYITQLPCTGSGGAPQNVGANRKQTKIYKEAREER